MAGMESSNNACHNYDVITVTSSNKIFSRSKCFWGRCRPTVMQSCGAWPACRRWQYWPLSCLFHFTYISATAFSISTSLTQVFLMHIGKWIFSHINLIIYFNLWGFDPPHRSSVLQAPNFAQSLGHYPGDANDFYGVFIRSWLPSQRRWH